MGAQNKSSSQSSSVEASNSNNTTLTQSLGSASQGVLGNNNRTSYVGSNSNDTTNAQTYALGASSTANGSTNSLSAATPDDSSSSLSSIDWGEVIVYVIGGILLVVALRFFGDKNA